MGLLTDKNLATNQLEKLEPAKAARLTGPCWVLLGLTGPFWVLLGLSAGPYWALLGLPGSYWVLLGLTQRSHNNSKSNNFGGGYLEIYFV